jgi:hypothetical protein
MNIPVPPSIQLPEEAPPANKSIPSQTGAVSLLDSKTVSVLEGILGKSKTPAPVNESKKNPAPVVESKYVDPKTAGALASILSKARPLDESVGKVTESDVKNWITSKINAALISLGVPQEKHGEVEDAVFTAALAGKLGNGLPSDETAQAIANMVTELAGTAAAPTPTVVAPEAPEASVTVGKEAGLAKPVEIEKPQPEPGPAPSGTAAVGQGGGEPELVVKDAGPISMAELEKLASELDEPAAPEVEPEEMGDREVPEEPELSTPEDIEAEVEKMADEMRDGEEPEGMAAEKGVSEKDVDSDELKMGIEVEQEHTNDVDQARKIALDHLAEFPKYYTELKKMEKKLGKAGSKKEAQVTESLNDVSRLARDLGYADVKYFGRDDLDNPQSYSCFALLSGEPSTAGDIVMTARSLSEVEAYLKNKQRVGTSTLYLQRGEATNEEDITTLIDEMVEEEEITEKVVKRGNKYCTTHCHGAKKGQVIHCFDTKEKAMAQHRAIQMSKHESFQEWGVRWTEFDRDNRLVTKEKIFSTERARNNFIDGRERKDNFGDVIAWLDPKPEAVSETKAEAGTTRFSLENAKELVAKYGRPFRVELKWVGRGPFWGYYTTAMWKDGKKHTFTGFAWGYGGEGPRGLKEFFKMIGVEDIDIGSIPNEGKLHTQLIEVPEEKKSEAVDEAVTEDDIVKYVQDHARYARVMGQDSYVAVWKGKRYVSNDTRDLVLQIAKDEGLKITEALNEATLHLHVGGVDDEEIQDIVSHVARVVGADKGGEVAAEVPPDNADEAITERKTVRDFISMIKSMFHVTAEIIGREIKIHANTVRKVRDIAQYLTAVDVPYDVTDAGAEHYFLINRTDLRQRLAFESMEEGKKDGIKRIAKKTPEMWKHVKHYRPGESVLVTIDGVLVEGIVNDVRKSEVDVEVEGVLYSIPLDQAEHLEIAESTVEKLFNGVDPIEVIDEIVIEDVRRELQ